MMAIELDTLKIVEQLEEAGYSTQQAKAQTAVLVSAISDEAAWVEDKFAPKSTINQELAGVKSEVGSLKKELHTELGSFRKELHAELGSFKRNFMQK